MKTTSKLRTTQKWRGSLNEGEPKNWEDLENKDKPKVLKKDYVPKRRWPQKRRQTKNEDDPEITTTSKMKTISKMKITLKV